MFEPSVAHGSKDVATAGTELPLTAASTWCRGVIIQAKPANTGYIYVGAGTVSSATYGIRLEAGDSLQISPPAGSGGHSPRMNLADIVIDSSVNGEGVTFLYNTDDYNTHTF